MNKKATLLNPHLIAKTTMPKRQTNLFILHYAQALQVIKSKTIGNFDVFMN
jgi:hypothetical protein